MENQQHPSPEQSYPPVSGYSVPEGKADLLDKIRPEDTIEEIKQRLLGNEFNKESGRWEPNLHSKKFALSPIGAFAITSLIFPASTRTISVSNLKDEEIKKRILSLIKTAMKMCLDNWKEYNMVSVSQFYFIKEIIYTNCLGALKQPENEGIRRMLNSTIQESRNVSTYGEEKRGGVLGMFRR